MQRLDRALQIAAGRPVRNPIHYVGAEVYYFPGMGRAEKLKELCIRPAFPEDTPGSDVILVEMPFVQWTDAIYDEICDILERQRMRVVLAHVERYPQFQKDERIWDKVMDLPLTVQINGGSFLKSRARRKFCLELIQSRRDVILGSDCHNLSSRRPNLKEAGKVIADKLGSEYLRQLRETAQHLL